LRANDYFNIQPHFLIEAAMSNYYKRPMTLAGIDLGTHSVEDLRLLVRQILEAKIHGLCFSPYVEGQGPGTQLFDAQIRERLAYIQPYVRWLRSFSCTDGHELIPGIAVQSGLKTMVGVWLDSDREHNEQELANAIEVARAGNANILAVGNEVLLRGDLAESELIDYIVRAQRAVPDIDVGYVDAYFKFVDHPRVTEVCDVILANCYPFWEGCPADHALLYMKEMYRRAVRAANGKKVIISETGWPNLGTAEKGAVPSFENAIRYFINTCRWAEEDAVEIFYFSSFDETWKVDAEGDVGAYWGLWDKDGNPKYV
jgi:exo-beta-1,3-glucanase (GH17 family)